MTDKPSQRRLAAILAADVVGYSRLMGADEAGTLRALREVWAVRFNPAVAAHGGRIVKMMGDGALVEFASAVDAVECAVAVQGRAQGGGKKGAFERDDAFFEQGLRALLGGERQAIGLHAQAAGLVD